MKVCQVPHLLVTVFLTPTKLIHTHTQKKIIRKCLFFFLSFHHKGTKCNLTANFGGFNTAFYRQRGCQSSACEGVYELNNLKVSSYSFTSTLDPSFHRASSRFCTTKQLNRSHSRAANSRTDGQKLTLICFLLQNSGNLGFSILGPTCTYATFQMVE